MWTWIVGFWRRITRALTLKTHNAKLPPAYHRPNLHGRHR